MSAREEQERRRQEALRRHLPNPFSDDARRFIGDRLAARAAIEKYTVQRMLTDKRASTVEVVA